MQMLLFLEDEATLLCNGIRIFNFITKDMNLHKNPQSTH